MKNFNIIMRGFAYKENWLPLSTRKERTDRYTINILNNINQYKKLINKLSTKYNVNFYISTYDTTPNYILKELSNQIDITDILLCEEKNSKQFTTSIKALDELNLSGLTLLLRSDLIIQDKLISIFSEHDFDDEHVYVLCFEKNGQKISDFFHIIPEHRISDVHNYFLELNMQPQHAHFLHHKVKTKTILDLKITFPIEYYQPQDSKNIYDKN